ncbi:hypothetical protein [Paludisphaera rhizosphaerae]|uniref:hypothetical protein n=1 Tax=Paludisphaera rhizosphaerae TaxID=2711216 RepID=UPI0013EE0F36|nr:hypothetical protein [Paludisphaera rhizosphaerae]
MIEIHDSRLAGIAWESGNLVLRFAPAYVHRSEGRPGVDVGTGWLLELDLIIAAAVAESLPVTVPVNLADGQFFEEETCWDNKIPLPLNFLGRVSLRAVTGESEWLIVRGRGASIVARGEPVYLEEYPGA